MPILGALLRNACHHIDYGYVTDILYVIRNEGLKPSEEIIRIVELFHSKRHYLLKSQGEAAPLADVKELSKFTQKLRRWQKYMGFEGLRKEEIIKLLREKPHKQYREKQVEGAEHDKNSNIRNLYKKGHTLHKFTKSKFDDEGGIRTPVKEQQKLESGQEKPEPDNTGSKRKRRGGIRK